MSQNSIVKFSNFKKNLKFAKLFKLLASKHNRCQSVIPFVLKTDNGSIFFLGQCFITEKVAAQSPSGRTVATLRNFGPCSPSCGSIEFKDLQCTTAQGGIKAFSHNPIFNCGTTLNSDVRYYFCWNQTDHTLRSTRLFEMSSNATGYSFKYKIKLRQTYSYGGATMCYLNINVEVAATSAPTNASVTRRKNSTVTTAAPPTPANTTVKRSGNYTLASTARAPMSFQSDVCRAVVAVVFVCKKRPRYWAWKQNKNIWSSNNRRRRDTFAPRPVFRNNPSPPPSHITSSDMTPAF